jgi:hypothetical protein
VLGPGDHVTLSAGTTPADSSWLIGLGGAMDIEFVDGTACGKSKSGVYRVDGPHSFTVVADIGTWSEANPPEPAFFIPTGVQYSMEGYHGDLIVADGHHNRLLQVTLGGDIDEIMTFSNVVPTGLAIKVGPFDRRRRRKGCSSYINSFDRASTRNRRIGRRAAPPSGGRATPSPNKAAPTDAGAAGVKVRVDDDKLRLRFALAMLKSSALTRPSRLKSTRPVRAKVELNAPLTAPKSSALTRKLVVLSPLSPTRLPK